MGRGWGKGVPFGLWQSAVWPPNMKINSITKSFSQAEQHQELQQADHPLPWPRGEQHGCPVTHWFICCISNRPEGRLHVAQVVKNLPVMQETWLLSPGLEDPLEKEMVTHSIILAWLIPWTEEPGGLQSIASHRVRLDWSNLACTHVCTRPITSVDKAHSPERAKAPGPMWAFIFPVVKIIHPLKRWQSIRSTPISKVTQHSLNKHFLSTGKVQSKDKEEGKNR